MLAPAVPWHIDMQILSFRDAFRRPKLAGKLLSNPFSMADTPCDCSPQNLPECAGTGQSVSPAGVTATQLPTLQRNALRKIFDRHEFTPEEVAALGYRRLQQAEGIGNKGLAAITEWLGLHGFELRPPEQSANPRQALPKRMRRNIESAVRLLRTHGYVVQQALENAQEGKGSV
ncbi:MAG: hypothetical protein HGA71_09145 [Azonexaceae bacterium]|nr:hypothetical protein [Azonexaceae bacterium]